MKGWIGVDFDGTLAAQGAPVTAIGAPIPAMLARVREWLANGLDVRIFTARVGECGQRSDENGLVDDAAFAREQRALIDAWCSAHFGRVLPITATKDFQMVALWDDLAVQVIPNTGEIATDLARRTGAGEIAAELRPQLAAARQAGADAERERLDDEASKNTHINCDKCGCGRRYVVARLMEEKAKVHKLETRAGQLLNELLNLKRRMGVQ